MNWQSFKIGEFLIKSDEVTEIQADRTYKQITVKMWGKGVVLRNEILGQEIKAKKRSVARSGQFILSRIDARHGAMGLVPDELDGAVVSNDFPIYVINHKIILPEFFNWLTTTQQFIDLCKRASEGTTNRVRMKLDLFYGMKIQLPSPEEQQRLVARIEELARHIEEARGLRQGAIEEAEALRISALSSIFDYEYDEELPLNWNWQALPQLLSDSKDGIKTGPFGTLLQKSEIVDYGISVVGIPNVQIDKFIDHYTDFVTPQKAQELSAYTLKKHDILVARSGTVGRSCVMPETEIEPIMSTNLMRLRLNTEKFLPNLLSRLFNGSNLIERHKERECRGSTHSFFTQKILKKLYIPVPPIEEQQEILIYLEEIQAQLDSLEQVQKKARLEMEALLPSILDQAFRGDL